MRSGAAAVALVVMVAATGVTVADVPLVDIENGRVSGIVEESMKGRDIYSFYGLPYALPPLGKLRFKNPQLPQSWEGTHEASVLVPSCLQYTFIDDLAGKKELVGREDCLYLNVFTPKIQEEGVLPVMVWFHGGGFFAGSAEKYLPQIILDHDVVLVVVQYRLGILGFLSTEDSVMPGNLGLKDQTMSLEWVQRNIHVFGGDKTQVTIVGQSAGGASVHYQMLTPKAEGLFSRAILQSGSALCPWAFNRTPLKVAFEVATSLGCPTDQGSNSLLVCLQGLDASVLSPLYQQPREWIALPNALTPWADGHYLPDEPAHLVLEGRHAKVDIISGVTRDEGAFGIPFLENKTSLEELQYDFSMAGPASLQLSDTKEDPVAIARQMYLHYLGTTHVTEAHAQEFMRLMGDRFFNMGHDLTTAHHAHHLHSTKKTFRYELQHKAEYTLDEALCPSCRYKWVSHADDLFYLFPGSSKYIKPTPDHPQGKTTRLQRSDDLALRDIMTTLWTNFAATGNPTPDASLGFTWEPSTADNLQFLSLTPSPSMQPDNRKEIRKFHNSLPTRENYILHPHLVEGKSYDAEDGRRSSKTEL